MLKIFRNKCFHTGLSNQDTRNLSSVNEGYNFYMGHSLPRKSNSWSAWLFLNNRYYSIRGERIQTISFRLLWGLRLLFGFCRGWCWETRGIEQLLSDSKSTCLLLLSSACSLLHWSYTLWCSYCQNSQHAIVDSMVSNKQIINRLQTPMNHHHSAPTATYLHHPKHQTGQSLDGEDRRNTVTKQHCYANSTVFLGLSLRACGCTATSHIVFCVFPSQWKHMCSVFECCRKFCGIFAGCYGSADCYTEHESVLKLVSCSPTEKHMPTLRGQEAVKRTEQCPSYSGRYCETHTHKSLLLLCCMDLK